MDGIELNVFVLTDGVGFKILPTAKDYKRIGEGDTGLNTGGMGAYSPAPAVTPQIAERVMRDIIEPTIAAMAARGMPYQGVLYAGLMLTAEGPKLIEYNVRFGDPETQVLMPRLKSDLVGLLVGAIEGDLLSLEPQWSDATALTVVMAADGYPGEPLKGTPIKGIAAAEAGGALVFHAFDGGAR